MRWVEFTKPGVFEFVDNTKFVDNVGGIEIRYSSDEELYDLLRWHDGKFWIAETSFRTEAAARNYIKN